MDEQLHRRVTDSFDAAEIEKLIAEEQDPRARTHLLILHKFNIALSNNIALTSEAMSQSKKIMDKFDEHVVDYNARVNRGQGAVKILTWILMPIIGILQAVAIYFWSDIHDTVKIVQSSMITISTEQARRSVVIEQMVDFMRTHSK